MRPAVLLVNALTLCNAACGLGAMAVLLHGESLGLSGPERLRYAALLIVFGAFWEVLVGLAARAFDASTELGAQLDIYADTVSFNIATVLLLLAAPFDAAGLKPADRPLWALFAGLAALVYMCAGLYRSSRLVTLAPPLTKRGRYFWGLTTNTASLSVGAFLFLGQRYPELASVEVRALLPVAMALPLSALMVSRIPFPDVATHVMKGILPYWLMPALLLLALLTGLPLPWSLLVFGSAFGPPVRHALGWRPA